MKHQHHKHSVFVIIVGIVVTVLLFRFVGTTDIIQILKTADKGLILVAILLQVPMFFFWNLKWKLVFNFIRQKVSFWKLWIILLIGNFADAVSPGSRVGGEPVRAYYLGKLGCKGDIALTTILLERVYNVIAFLALAFVSFMYAFLNLSLPVWLALLMVGVFEFALLLCLLVAYAFQKEKRGVHYIMSLAGKFLPYVYKMKHTALHKKYKTYAQLNASLQKTVKHFFGEVIVLSKSKVLLAEGTFLSFAHWFVFYLQAWLIFQAIGSPVPFYFIVVMLTLSDLAGIVLFIPSGAGIVEVLMIIFATSVGIPVASAVAATLLIRGIYYIFSLTTGYAGMLYFEER